MIVNWQDVVFIDGIDVEYNGKESVLCFPYLCCRFRKLLKDAFGGMQVVKAVDLGDVVLIVRRNETGITFVSRHVHRRYARVFVFIQPVF